MNKGLEIGVLALLCFNTAGAIRCIECKQVAPDNSCMVAETQCSSPMAKLCYTRRTTKGSAPPIVDRGCAFLCYSIWKQKDKYQEMVVCCAEDLCNTGSFGINI